MLKLGETFFNLGLVSFLSRVPLEDGYSSAGGLGLTERMTV